MQNKYLKYWHKKQMESKLNGRKLTTKNCLVILQNKPTAQTLIQRGHKAYALVKVNQFINSWDIMYINHISIMCMVKLFICIYTLITERERRQYVSGVRTFRMCFLVCNDICLEYSLCAVVFIFELKTVFDSDSKVETVV